MSEKLNFSACTLQVIIAHTVHCVQHPFSFMSCSLLTAVFACYLLKNCCYCCIFQAGMFEQHSSHGASNSALVAQLQAEIQVRKHSS